MMLSAIFLCWSPRKDIPRDMISDEECTAASTKTLDILQGKLHGDDQDFLEGVLKFLDRVKNMSKSILTSVKFQTALSQINCSYALSDQDPNNLYLSFANEYK